MPKQRRILLRLIMIGLVLIGGLLFFFGALVIYSTCDTKPIDDSAYLPKFTSLDNRNPLAQFQEWNSTHPFKSDWKAPSLLSNATESDRDEARRLLKKHESVLAKFDEFQASDYKTWRWRDADAMAHADALVDYLSTIQGCANLANYRARLALMDKREDDAQKEGLRLMRTGQGLARSQGGLIHFLVAAAVQAIGQRIVSDAVIANPTLAKSPAMGNLASFDISPHDLGFSMRFEYFMFKNTIDDLQSGRLSDGAIPQVPAMRLLLNKNKTIARYLDIQGPSILAIEDGWLEGLKASPPTEAVVRGIKANPIATIARGNVCGDILLTLMLPTYSKITEKGASMNALSTLTQCQMAIMRHKQDHNHYPEHLAELVPQYLQAVPNDIFSGKPLLWSLQKRIVYSVGSNRKDDGGSINVERPTKGLDLGIQLPEL